MPKVVHYRNKCIGCGICFEMLPSVWRMSKKDGKATLLNAIVKRDIAVLSINSTIEERLKAIAKACPVKIIKVV